MNTKYTKQQIQNAIKYWTRKLNTLNESKLHVIDELVMQFGEDIVLSKEHSFTPTTQELKAIYDILNNNLFNGELKTIPVTYCNSISMADRYNTYNAVSNNNEPTVDKMPARAMHLAASKENKDSNGNLKSIDFFSNIIMMNSDYMLKNVFIFVVATLCHEMIHYCDSFSKEMHDKFLADTLTGNNDTNYHENTIFQEKMQEANENGIRVVEHLTSDDRHEADMSRVTLKNVLGENEKFQESEVIYGNQMIYVRNKKTGRGTFMQYD